MLSVVEIKKLEMNPDFYPRHQVNRIVAYKYSEIMKTGVIFPPVTAAEFGKKLILVDGWHRVTALKINKEKYVQVDILRGLSKEQIFIEAIKRNIEHGYQLSSSELTRCILKLQDMKVSLIDISSITHIAVDKIQPFVAKRLTNDVTGQPVILKKGTWNLAGMPVAKNSENTVDDLSGCSQGQLLEDLIKIIKSGWLDIENKYILRKANILYGLLSNVLFVVPEEKPKKSKKK